MICRKAAQLQVELALGVFQAVALINDDKVPVHRLQARCISHQEVVAGQQELKIRFSFSAHLFFGGNCI